MKKSIILPILLILSLIIVQAQSFPDYQNKYVNDFASILSPDQQQTLFSLFSSIDQQTTAEITFVSMTTINGEDISAYAPKLGQTWGVGKSDKDNGLVILYVQDINKIYVATGYGLEGILPDGKVGRILDESYVPYRDLGNLSQGILQASQVYAQVILDNKEEVLSGNASPNISSYIPSVIVTIIIVILFGLMVYSMAKRQKKKGFLDFWDFFFADFIARMLIGILLGGRGRSSGGIGGFSSGGGGGGFGGGGFGGGGAGR